MDKCKKVAQVFSIENKLAITVANGEVTQCCFEKIKVTPQSDNFYKVLGRAMNLFSKKEPRAFVNFFKSLNLNTREFKLGQKIICDDELLKARLERGLRKSTILQA